MTGGSKFATERVNRGEGGSILEGDLENNSGIVGLDVDENAHLLDNIISKAMNEKCTLNLVPTNKMLTMLNKYVSSNDAHELETFFDHEVFRKSYHEVRKNLQEMNLVFENKSYLDI